MDIQYFFALGMDRVIPHLLEQQPSTLCLNLGAGNKIVPGAIDLDYPDWDADKDPIPFEDGCISTIHAYHFLKHVADPVKVLQECQRVLRPGGVLNIVVPYYSSQMAAHDLDHKHAFCEDTWKILFSNPYYDKNKIDWQFRIHANFIMGIAERNLALFTQLVKTCPR